MGVEIKNNLNLWKYKDYCPWYRIDLKIVSFFRKVKWAWQRAKYGWCDRDIWNLDYTLASYISTSIVRLAETTDSYPYGLTKKEWGNILRNIAENFYLSANEECYDNPYNDMLVSFGFVSGRNRNPEREEVYTKWKKVEEENDKTREAHRQEGFKELQEWFLALWD